MRALRDRRSCAGPPAGILCATAPARGRRPPRTMTEVRIRSSCRRREDFTGRGFGRNRLREAR